MQVVGRCPVEEPVGLGHVEDLLDPGLMGLGWPAGGTTVPALPGGPDLDDGGPVGQECGGSPPGAGGGETASGEGAFGDRGAEGHVADGVFGGGGRVLRGTAHLQSQPIRRAAVSRLTPNRVAARSIRFPFDSKTRRAAQSLSRLAVTLGTPARSPRRLRVVPTCA